jgi:hypothetical protein
MSTITQVQAARNQADFPAEAKLKVNGNVVGGMPRSSLLHRSAEQASWHSRLGAPCPCVRRTLKRPTQGEGKCLSNTTQ